MTTLNRIEQATLSKSQLQLNLLRVAHLLRCSLAVLSIIIKRCKITDPLSYSLHQKIAQVKSVQVPEELVPVTPQKPSTQEKGGIAKNLILTGWSIVASLASRMDRMLIFFFVFLFFSPLLLILTCWSNFG